MSNIFLDANDLALIREALDDLAWDLDTRADEFHHARPDDALSAREQQISEDQNAVKRLLEIIPKTESTVQPYDQRRFTRRDS